jgi:hypothetical protein
VWCFLVVMLVHTHTAAVSTWSHVRRVEKNPTPHQNRQRKTMQKQNTTCLTAILVAATKQFYPHKERERLSGIGEGDYRDSNSGYGVSLILSLG